jgi:hypothetical protein
MSRERLTLVMKPRERPPWDRSLSNLLVGLAIVLAIVTLLGHGSWVFLAWLFLDIAAPSAPAVPRQCLYCNRPTLADHACCIWCHRSQEDTTARRLADIKTAQRVALRLRTEKLLTAEQRAEWNGRLEEYHQRLLLPASEPQVTPPAPVRAKPIEKPPEPPAPLSNRIRLCPSPCASSWSRTIFVGAS